MSKKLKPAVLLSAAALLALGLLLAACNGDPTSTPAPPPATATPAPTATSAAPPAATNTPAPTATVAPTATRAPSPTATAVPVPTPTPTPRPVPPTATPSPTATPEPTPTTAPTPTATPEPTPEPTPTVTVTPHPNVNITTTPAAPLDPDATEEPESGEEPEGMGEPGDSASGMMQGMTEPVELAPNVYHYFSSFYSNLIVVSDDGVLVTDTANTARAEELKQVVAGITDVPVTQIVLTHEHYDHVGGTAVFDGATVYCHRNCQPIFDLHPSRTDPDLAIPLLGDVPESITTYNDRLDLTVGDITVELHYLGPGDGDATTVIYLPDQDIVVTSDLYEPRALSGADVVDDKNFTGVRQILNTVSDWPLTHAINAHSPGTDPVDLRENVAYYNDLYDAVKVEVDAAITAAGGAAFGAYGLFNTLPQTLQLDKYQDWGNYETAFPKHVERMLLAIYHGD